MEEKRYELRILPLFEEKLQETADYIAFRLRNPIAAEDFVDAVEVAVFCQENRLSASQDSFFDFRVFVSQIRYRANVQHDAPSFLSLSKFYHNLIIFARESFIPESELPSR